MLQNIFNKNKSSEIQFLEIDLFWTFNSFYQVRFLIWHPRFWKGTTTVLTTDLSQDRTKTEMLKNFKIKKMSGYLFMGVSTVSLYRMNCFSTKIGVFLKCSMIWSCSKMCDKVVAPCL